MEEYIQIPLDRCSGKQKKSIIIKAAKILEKHGFETNVDTIWNKSLQLFTIRKVSDKVKNNGNK